MLAATGRRDKMRYVHAITIAGMSAFYLSTEYLVKDSLAPAVCRWCEPPGFDRSVRDALVWSNVDRAETLGDVTAFVAQPLGMAGLLVAASWPGDRRRWFDDLAPVLEAGISVSIIDQAFKFAIGRSRPFVRFGPPERPPEVDDNVSFFSGHAALAFSLAVSAGVVAHRRGYRLEPAIWATGLTIATATAYLRIAADKHYLTDVAVGAVVGAGFGYLVPRLLHIDVLYRARDGGVRALIPTARGVALVGSF